MTVKGRRDRLANEGISFVGGYIGYPTMTQTGKRMSSRGKGTRRGSRR